MRTSILITGCGSGIGFAAACGLKERGYRVFAAVRKEEDRLRLEALGLESVLLDLNDSHSMQRALAEVLKKTDGTLDALFNNAGILYAGALEDLTDEMIRAQFETNLFGPMQLTQLVLPIMRAQGHGRIVQNSSILGIITMPFYGAYNASKFALEGFSSSLRQELRGTNIHVSLINPGPIQSKLRENAFAIYQQTIQKQQTGHHKTVYQRLEQSYFTERKGHKNIMISEEAVVEKLIHALESSHPKAHYFIGKPAKIMAWLKRCLPDSALDWIIAKLR